MLTSKKIKKITAFSLAFMMFFALGTALVMAQEEEGGTTSNEEGGTTSNEEGGTTDNTSGKIAIKVDLDNPFNDRVGDSLFGLLNTIIQDFVLPVGGILAVLGFIFSGFLYVTAQGNETKIGKAHTALLYSAIGTALLLGSAVFAQLISRTIDQLR